MKKLFICLFGALFCFLNVNAQWQQTGLKSGYVYGLAISDNHIYATSYGDGVFVSSNNGDTWKAINSGLTGNSLYTMSIAADQNAVYLGTNGKGVFKSENHGETWNNFSNGLKEAGLIVHKLLVNGNQLILGSDCYGLYSSPLSESNWIQMETEEAPRSACPASVAASGSLIGIGCSTGIYLSQNGGGDWIEIHDPLIYLRTVFSLVFAGGNIIAGVSPNGICVSTDNGKTWTNKAAMGTTVSTLIEYKNQLFGINFSNTYISKDNGLNFVEKINDWAQAGATEVFSSAISNDTIFIGTNMGVWKSAVSNLVTGSDNTRIGNNFKIYPNPVGNFINIQSENNQTIFSVRLYNLNGQIFFENQRCQDLVKINTGSFKQGLYLLEIRSDYGVRYEKFIKN